MHHRTAQYAHLQDQKIFKAAQLFFQKYVLTLDICFHNFRTVVFVTIIAGSTVLKGGYEIFKKATDVHNYFL